MGRWAQQRRRGGGGGAPGSITPSGVSIIAVQGIAGQWVVTFSDNIVQGAGNDDSAFFVGDATTTHLDNIIGPQAFLTDDGTAGYVPGLPWSLTSQPAWLLTPILGPASGTTT